MDSEKKNPSPWEEWILVLLMVTQILTIAYFRQENLELWKAVYQRGEDVIQLGDRLSDHLEQEIRHNEAMNQLAEEENQLLERCGQKLIDFLNQNPVGCK